MVSGLKTFLKSLGVVSAGLVSLGLLYSLLTRNQHAPVMRFSPPTDKNLGRQPAVLLNRAVHIELMYALRFCWCWLRLGCPG